MDDFPVLVEYESTRARLTDRQARSLAATPFLTVAPDPEPGWWLVTAQDHVGSLIVDGMRLLLEGEGDKQIAKALRISPHTVNQYVKAIFEHFRVGSRAELLARWVRRGWNSRATWCVGSERGD